MEKFEELKNHVKQLHMDVESDSKRKLENRKIVLSKCNEFRKNTTELESLVLQCVNDEESKCNVTEGLIETSAKLLLMEEDYKRAELAGEILKTKNKELEDQERWHLCNESSLKSKLATGRKALKQLYDQLQLANHMHDSLLQDYSVLDSSLGHHFNVEADLKNQLETKTTTLKNVEEDLIKANLANEKLKARIQKYNVHSSKCRDVIKKLKAKWIQQLRKNSSKRSSGKSKRTFLRKIAKLRTEQRKNDTMLEIEEVK